MIIEEIRSIKSTKKDLRTFGLTVGGVLFAAGVVLLYFDKGSSSFFLIAGGALLASGLVMPGVLLPVQKAWMTFGVVMGWVMTRVVLSLLFFLVMTPIALVSRLSGKRFLDVEIDRGRASYWNRRKPGPAERKSYERQF